MFTITKCFDNQLLHKFQKELKIIPKYLSNYLFNNGLKLEIYDKEIINHGKYHREYHSDTLLERESAITSGCLFPDNIIQIVDYKNQDEEWQDFTSLIIHEIAHVIDYLLGQNGFWSDKNIEMLKIPLDDYAAIDNREQFAQAFEGYFQPSSKKQKSWWKYWHTRDEVFKKEPKLFEFFGELLKENSGCFNA